MAGLLGAIGSIAGYALGGPAGAAIGGQIGGGIDTNQANQDAAQASMNFSANQYATRYQTTVKDLEAAGLSPMLAYSQGAGTPPTGVSYTAQNPYAGLASSYSQVANLESQGRQLEASAANLNTSATLNQHQLDVVDATADKIRADTAQTKGNTNFDVQQEILRKTAYRLQQQGNEAQEKGISEGQWRNMAQATINNLQKDGTLKQLDINAAERFNNWGRQYKEIAPAVDIILKALFRK